MTAIPLNTAKLIIGGNVFGWTLDEAASFKILDALFERGFRTLDTANIYSAWVPGNTGGESEHILGKWIKARGHREELVIITKVGMPVHGETGLDPAYIQRACEASLQRLNTSYVDVYLSHQEDTQTPIVKTLEAYQHLLEQQKVRSIGGSNYSFEGLKASVETAQAQGLTPYQVYQPQYNLYDREAFEKEFQPFCQTHQIQVIPYHGLASGFLTGKYRQASDADQSPRGQGIVDKYINPRGQRILKALDHLATETQTTPAAVALAWLMVQPTIAAPIASVTKPQHIEDLSRAVDLSLTAAQLDLLAEASKTEAVKE